MRNKNRGGSRYSFLMETEETEYVEADEEVDPEEIQRFKLCLVGRLLTVSSFNSGALQSTFRQMWRLQDAVQIRELEKTSSPFNFSIGKIFIEWARENLGGLTKRFLSCVS